MKIIIPIIIILVLLLIILPIVYRKILISKYIKTIANHFTSKGVIYKLEKVTNHKNTFHLLLEGQSFYFFLIVVPTNSQIQINNKVTWELKTGGGSDPGKAPTKKELLTKIIPFMNANFQGKKSVIFLPYLKKAVMYINECEIVLVNKNTNVHGVNVISGFEVDHFH